MAETIVAGANALTWTPPSAQEMQSSMTMRYRGEHSFDPRRGQGRVLATLRESDQTSQKDLAAMFGMSRQAMAELLKKLEASGHISRRPSRRDSRVMVVSLTDRGRKVADLLGNAPDQTSSMLDCLNETELQTLHGYLQRIINASSDGLPASTAEDAKKRELLIEHLKRKHRPRTACTACSRIRIRPHDSSAIQTSAPMQTRPIHQLNVILHQNPTSKCGILHQKHVLKCGILHIQEPKALNRRQ